MNIETIAIETLHSDPANVRKHDQKNLDSIAGSLKSFNQQKPIVIDFNNVVIAGNGTLAAAKALGWRTIECVRTDLAGAEKIAFALADNRTAELAEWDTEGLSAQLDALLADGFDVSEIGFDPPREDKKNSVVKGEKSGDTIEVTCPDCGHEFTERL